MISNQPSPEGYAGFQEAYESLERTGHLASFRYVTPLVTAASRGHDASLSELLGEAEDLRPDVVLVVTPRWFDHEPSWVTRFLRSCGRPTVLYYEADPWARWSKPVNRSMKGWFAAADVVFTVARHPHVSLFRSKGARDVRFIPQTYCQVDLAGAAERPPSLDPTDLLYDAVLIGRGLARWGRVARIPGTVQRASLVRKLQRRADLKLAIYGPGWSGRGTKGVLPFTRQVSAIREGLMSVNWDHFPGHESYASDRLPISMLAGRPHVTTSHPGLEWLPGEEMGMYLEPTVSAILARIDELRLAPIEQVLAAGTAAHLWVRDRLSHREAARFMLAAVDSRFLKGLPAEPWDRFAAEWPK